jgi:hypothetical protein
VAALLAYVPPLSGRVSVVEAVNADPRLDESDREPLVTVCRWLVQRGALETTELTSRSEDGDTECLLRELG